MRIHDRAELLTLESETTSRRPQRSRGSKPSADRIEASVVVRARLTSRSRRREGAPRHAAGRRCASFFHRFPRELARSPQKPSSEARRAGARAPQPNPLRDPTREEEDWRRIVRQKVHSLLPAR